jgi:hypothetical protein
LGGVAAKVAGKLGLAGTFECLDRKKNDRVISPETKLADLPEDTEITLADNPTPARRACPVRQAGCGEGKGAA